MSNPYKNISLHGAYHLKYEELFPKRLLMGDKPFWAKDFLGKLF